MRKAALILAGTLGVGCGVGTATGPSEKAPLRLAPPDRGHQVTFGPFDVKQGGEVQLCRTLKLPNEEPIAVNRLEVLLTPGSHHYILFRSKKSFPDQTFPCWGTVNFEDWSFVMDVNKTGGHDWKLDDGQGFILEPHAQIMVQVHYVNASKVKTPEGGMTFLNLHQIDLAQVKHTLHGMFVVNTNLALPPRAKYASARLCSLSRSIHIVAMTGHFHQRGLLFTVDKLTTPDPLAFETELGEPLYWSDNWDAPVFKVFAPPVWIGDDLGSEALRFSCTYFNETDHEIGFGGQADVQEHCNLFAQYYYDTEDDSLAPVRCLEGAGGW